MRVGVLCNGSVEDYGWLHNVLCGLDSFICADGGTNHAYRLGLKPTLIVGDLDSIRSDVLAYYQEQGVTVKRSPREKDETDQQIAINEAINQGAQEILLLGAIGKRFDHTLGSLSVLAYLHAKGIQGILLDEQNEIVLREKEAVIEGQVGEEVSLLPFTPLVTGVTTENLKYPLKDGTFTAGNPYGISNVLTAPVARVTMKEGLLLVIKSRDT